MTLRSFCTFTALCIAIFSLIGWGGSTTPLQEPQVKALREAERIDYSMQLYYQEHGQWPASVAELAYQGAMLVRPEEHHATLNWKLERHAGTSRVRAKSHLDARACEAFNRQVSRPGYITCHPAPASSQLEVDLTAGAHERQAAREAAEDDSA